MLGAQGALLRPGLGEKSLPALIKAFIKFPGRPGPAAALAQRLSPGRWQEGAARYEAIGPYTKTSALSSKDCSPKLSSTPKMPALGLGNL